jgi:outer membrane murein-binding lipoprotein Lpp
MKRTSTQFRDSFPRGCLQSSVLILCVSAVALSGCTIRPVKARPFPWNASAHMHPLSPEVQESQLNDGSDLVPDLQPELTPPPSTLVIARSAPARPRVPVAAPPQNDAPVKADVPQLAPQLSAAETSAAQQQTNQSLGIAEKNIGASEGKTLNAAQQDLATKVRSFMTEAQEAVRIGDWIRARNAAKKAEVLSQELAGSL